MDPAQVRFQQPVIGVPNNLPLAPQFIMILIIYFILLGSIIGSFLNVVIDRWGTKRSIVSKRSHCEACSKKLQYIDLIPIVSFLMLRGRCRYCNNKFPFRILLVEIISALAIPVLYYLLGTNIIVFILILIIFYILLAIFFIDMQFGIIPDRLTIGLFLAVIALLVFIDNTKVLNHILSSLGTLSFFLLLFIGTKGKGMGFGDVKLSFVLGLFLGFPNIVIALYSAFLTGAVLSIILVLWGKKSFSKGTIPFGPFLVLSAIFAYFFGEKLILPILLQLL